MALSPIISPISSHASTFTAPGRPEYVPGRISDEKYVRVLDTTLRDGEQAAGAAMSRPEKLAVARKLAVIEAGFPASSRAALETTRTIAAEGAALR